jgi:hypothetical protein
MQERVEFATTFGISGHVMNSTVIVGQGQGDSSRGEQVQATAGMPPSLYVPAPRSGRSPSRHGGGEMVVRESTPPSLAPTTPNGPW